MRIDPLRRTRQPLSETEWNFKNCPDEEVRDCFYYEFHRNIPEVREWITKWRNDTGRRFFQKRLAPVIEGYVRVIERQRNGRPHVHWMFRLITSACTDDWKIIKLAIQRYGRMFGFGRFGCDPVETSQEAFLVLGEIVPGGCVAPHRKGSDPLQQLAPGKVCNGSRRWSTLLVALPKR
jgi:hypothetical protein